MKKLTLQDVFNLGYIGVIRQGKQSAGADGYCLYRGPDGIKCAIGHCIPDELYTPNLENIIPVSSTFWNICGGLFELDSIDFGRALRDFQWCHDGYEERGHTQTFLEYFQEQCKVFAHKHGLTIPEIN